MRMFRLTVVEIEPNPEYDAAREAERQRYGHDPYGRQPQASTIETERVRVVIDEAAYNALRRATIEALP